MMKQLFTIFEKDGEEYIADESTVLTSNPPQYTCYRLSDGKSIYQFCWEVRRKFKRNASAAEMKKIPRISYCETIPKGDSVKDGE